MCKIVHYTNERPGTTETEKLNKKLAYKDSGEKEREKTAYILPHCMVQTYLPKTYHNAQSHTHVQAKVRP